MEVWRISIVASIASIVAMSAAALRSPPVCALAARKNLVGPSLGVVISALGYDVSCRSSAF